VKFRHAAAFVLVGWYLIAPPVTFGKRPDGTVGWKSGVSEPLRKWQKLEAFNSAQACNARMLQLYNDAAAKIDNSHYNLSNPNDQRAALEADSEAVAECVSSDDPRLNKK
jgi:hypothetical protein